MVELVSLAKRGIIKPVVSNRFKLNQTTEALRMLKDGKYWQRCNKSLKASRSMIAKDEIVKTINSATEELLNGYPYYEQQTD
jgi:hypothetical protein